MKTIELTQGKVAIVDDEDYEYLNKLKWYYSNGYAIRNLPTINGKRGTMWMHRVIINTPDKMDTDHKNGDMLDNRRINLRACTHSDNLLNRDKTKKNIVGYKGVYIKKGRKHNIYCAAIKYTGKLKHLGYFRTPKEAAKTYNKAALKYHGEFAKINDI